MQAALGHPCLCLFDVDRVLTSTQFQSKEWCLDSTRHEGITDHGRPLITSPLFERLHDTFCGRLCHIGILTAGTANGFQDFLWSNLRALPLGHMLPDSAGAAWLLDSDARKGQSAPFLYSTGEGNKEQSVPGILRWLLHQHNVSLPKHRVFFFDDKSINVRPFSQTGFNARQVSCASRDYRSVYEQGYCGGVPEEVVPELGVRLCANLSLDLSVSRGASGPRPSEIHSRYVELSFFSSLVASLAAERDEARSHLRTEHRRLLGAISVFAVLLLLLLLLPMLLRVARSRDRRLIPSG